MNEQLRNNETYHMQKVFDRLYADSRNHNHFYHLYEIITGRDNILLAYQNLRTGRNPNTAGIDGRTIKWFEKMTEDELVHYVQERLFNYQPKQVIRTMIPTKSGYPVPYGIPTISDRLVEQCFLQVLTPIAEAKFYRHNYGSRPCRSASHALSRMVSLVNVAKMYYCVNGMIPSFLDLADHGYLMRQLWAFGIRDKKVLSVIRKMLKSPVHKQGVPDRGILQAGILAPLLSNICLDAFDHWVETQWEAFPVKGDIHNFHRNPDRTHLKSGYLVRYNHEFKIMCRSYDDAMRFCYAAKNYLSKHLFLDMDALELSVSNLKKKHADFLGFDIKAIEKKSARYGWVIRTKMSAQAKEQAARQLKDLVVKIQYHSFDSRLVQEYNAAVVGIKSYYQYATDIYCDLDVIGMSLSRVIKNRLSDRGSWSTCGSQSAEYRKQNPGVRSETKVMTVCGIPMHIINGVKHRSPMNLNQETTPYTKVGRERMMAAAVRVKEEYLKYLADTSYWTNEPAEYLNHRLSRYIQQKGVCAVLDIQFHPKDMECHHIRMKKRHGGSPDHSIRNLVWVHRDVHTLIHATSVSVVNMYMQKLHLTGKQLEKINGFREKLGNPVIECSSNEIKQ